MGKTAACIITWILRLAVGGLFVFSGLTKGIDVWGTLFKFREYFGALGFEVWDALNLVGVFVLCLVEFLTGFALLLGCFRRATPWVALLIMAVMLPLTLWLAVKEPIADCGCFGDAFKLTNWETFWKNVALTAGIVWLIIYNRKAGWLITPYLQWIGAVVAGAYFLIIAFIGYYYQPLIDFRPYKIGTPLVDEEDDPADDEQDYMVYVYEKNGVQKEFTIDDVLPDESEGWKFVERKVLEGSSDPNTLAPAPKEPSEKTIRFFTPDGRDDITADVIGDGRQLILMMPDLSEVPPARTWKINSFYQWSQANDIDMLATVGGYPDDIREWEDISLAEYPIYTSDDTAIKEVVRGNPAVIYLEDGIIKWKSSLRAINIDDFQNPQVNTDPMTFARDDSLILNTLTWFFLIAEGVLIFLSFFAQGIWLWWRRSHAKVKGKIASIRPNKNEKQQ